MKDVLIHKNISGALNEIDEDTGFIQDIHFRILMSICNIG